MAWGARAKGARIWLAALAAGLIASAGAAQPAATPAPGLEAIRARIVAGEIPGVHSVMVVHDGRTLAEWYFRGQDEVRGAPGGTVAFNAESLHDIRSVSKSVVSMLFGIAMAEGRIASLDEPVLNYFPEYADLRTPERMRIRLRDLLSMTSGFAWDENTFPYSDPRNSETAMDMAPDRLRYVLTQRIVAEPGARWAYSGGDVALIGAVLARVTHQRLDRYGEARLFRPLGIHAVWLRDDHGVPYAASGLRMRTRDMATIGQVMLDGGRWRGRQVVPAAWVSDAMSVHSVVQPGDCGTRYGYFWWIGPGCSPTGAYPWVAGIGNGGQRIWIVPSRRIVVVSTMGLYNDPRQRAAADGLFRAVLVAVLTAPPPAPAPAP